VARIEVIRDIPIRQDVVWDALADLPSHASWMKDAESIEFRGGSQRGVGTVMEVKTRVGPLRTLDVLEVTGWNEGESIDVEHRGLVTGVGTLGVSPASGCTRVTWVEDLRFPWWLGGPITALFAKPVLAAIWRGNLARLEQSLTDR
jgi:hypothetical protein